MRVAALAEDLSVIYALESAARGLIDAWRRTHNGAINKLKEADRDRFYNIWRQAKVPQEVTPIFPTLITAADRVVSGSGPTRAIVDVPRFPKHIYSNGKRSYPVRLTGWEGKVLAAELATRTLHGWYRNPSSGRAALAIPYEISGEARTLYPDFVFIHQLAGGLVLDIVDPHRPNEGDTGPKWLGLATYAQNHGHYFRRILAVIEDNNGQLVSLDLKNSDVKSRFEKAHNEKDVRAIFDDLGGVY